MVAVNDPSSPSTPSPSTSGGTPGGSAVPEDGAWWRHAVVYQVYVRSFADGDGDGVGDLPGITSRLPHLRDLGVDALWITPFYTSPQRDHGYDVADYRDVDPLFGSLSDADDLLARAHELGLKVIVDLVPNHTSDRHPWFQAALAAGPGSPERARYMFVEGRGEDGDLPPNNWPSVFGGDAWTRVTEADGTPGQWYLHLFDSTQPDLNWRNPEVGDEFESVLRFWLDRGVDGFRVDVAHGLFKEEGLPDTELPDPDADGPASMVELAGLDEPMWDQPEVHEVYRRWHRVLADYDDSPRGRRMAVAESWARTAEAIARYVRPDELQQSFNFHWLSAAWSAEEFAEVVTETLPSLLPYGATPTWVLSNHDVVRHVTRYGGGELGLARGRAATLAMLGLPGSAYLYQGEELGLEQVEVAPEDRTDPSWFRTKDTAKPDIGRDGCRVPIPWGDEEPPYAFGPAAAGSQPWLPQPDGWAPLSVAAQTGAVGSTLEFYRRALAARRTFALTAGEEVEILDAGADVFAYRRGPLVCVLNAGSAPVGLPDGVGALVLSSGVDPTGTLAPDTAAWFLDD
ncbi:glycoside hydrolase family 13 protein [Nocardioides sp. ChNu-153]|uniref:glycoside hydrolase family 13 protein n=1 Tax=Nocardioides sp. ChNu-153 TaxID=2779364 RepID=UPI00264F52CC|nr:glycoside hydrolase family 13 protein [Nocardioides sp. ChNu-153]MDN7123211.1 glycoside hydrolase family 13 protein [Nocardioides sp. ChNu-153]